MSPLSFTPRATAPKLLNAPMSAMVHCGAGAAWARDAARQSAAMLARIMFVLRKQMCGSTRYAPSKFREGDGRMVPWDSVRRTTAYLRLAFFRQTDGGFPNARLNAAENAPA